MKRSVFAFLCILVSVFNTAVAQTDSELLQAKLAKFNVIQADFKQQVISPEGEIIQQSTGQLTISRPGNFYWQVQEPDEELIVSNGTDIWLYSPFIEQVSILNFADAVAGTPFVLLSGADASQWANFTVARAGNEFTISNNDQNNNTTFTFIFDDKDNISEFRVQESQGQLSTFKLTANQKSKEISSDFFEFNIPAGVEIDDQR